MKRISLLLILALSLFLTSCTNSDTSIDKVKVMLSWSPSAEHAFLYYGIEKNFFLDENIEVEVLPSKGSSMVAQILAGKECEFGFISGDYLVVSRTKGMPLRGLATLYHDSPVTIYSLGEKNIKKPKDLIGKRVAVLKQSATYPQFKSMLMDQSIPLEKILEYPSKGSPQEILQGLVDAAMHYTNYAPVILRARGHVINEMLLKDYGIHTYSTTIATYDDLIHGAKKNKNLVERFMRALLRSLDSSKENPQEALQSFLKAAPELDKKVQEATLARTNSMIFSADTKQLGAGYMTKEGWENTQHTLLRLKQIDTKIDSSYFYDTSFFDKYRQSKE